MIVKTLTPPEFGANCYLVMAEEEAIIIDPSVTVERMKKALGSHQVKAIFITHGHFDHIFHLKSAQEAFQVPIYLHENALEKLEDPRRNYSVVTNEKFVILQEEINYQLVKDKETLTGVLPTPIEVLETFGHTNCSISLIIENFLFTGDVLFYENVGRTDLYTSDFAELLRSLKRLEHLEKDFTVYPGHGKPTKLSYEIKTNAYFQMK